MACNIYPQTPIFFIDWDNTLFITDYIISRHNPHLCKAHISHALTLQLKQLQHELVEFLEEVARYGRIYIVTNGTQMWVESCLEQFFPKVKEVLSFGNPLPRVYSARDLFSHAYPRNPIKWKVQTFLKILGEVDMGSVGQILSLGDSQTEREALFTVAKLLPMKCLAKSIKFMNSEVDATTIRRELALIKKNLKALTSMNSNVDLLIKLFPIPETNTGVKECKQGQGKGEDRESNIIKVGEVS